MIDFTPLWDKARIGANREMDGADVPIDPKFIFTAIFNRITPEGDTLRQTVDVTQKLVVKKWRDTEEYEAFSYIASIVPTPEYYAKHKNVGKDFQYGGGKGSFSGFVMYHTLDGRLVAIDNFRDGKHTKHDYFPVVKEENVDSIAQVAVRSMATTEFQGGIPRAFIEDGETLVSDDVTVTAPKPNPFPDRPTGLPDPTPDPIDRPDYGGGGGGGGGGGNPSTPAEPWTGPTHDNIIDDALKNLTSTQRSQIKAGSRQADVSKYQKPEYNYMHALRQPGQSIESAIAQMKNYFCTQVRSFATYNDLHALGMALHPIMDAYSPPHQRIAEFNTYNPLDWMGHIGETDSNYPWDARQAGNAIDNIYDRVSSYPINGATDAQIGSVFDQWVAQYEQEVGL